VFADEQVKHLRMAQSGTRPDGSEEVFVGQPFSLSRTKTAIAATPPELGEHTDEVLEEFGFSSDEIAALHEAKVV
jgi:formyl-CoA transferase